MNLSKLCSRSVAPLALLSATLLTPGASSQTVTTIVNNGPSSELYDMVILGDGYTAAQQALFNQDCLDVVNYFRNTPNKFPYGAYFNFYNVHTVFRASNQSGADQPPNNIFRDTVYDATYWTGGTERCLYIQNTSLATRDAALAPDTDGRVIVLVNDSKYGGCASTFSVGYNGSLMEDVQAHEWGHSFAGLADEYGGSGTYNGGEFSQPNITNSRTGNKWAEWLGARGPISVVGAYEGAHYNDFGVWRPETDCEMRSLNRPFCAVCRQHMIRRFHQQVTVISSVTPSTSTVPTRQRDNVDFAITHRIGARPHVVEWRVGAAGAWQLGTTQFRWNVGNTPAGPTSVSVRVRDTSPDVRRDPGNDLIHEHSWAVDVQAFNPALETGIGETLPASLTDANGPATTGLPFNQPTGSRVLQAYDRSTLGHDHPVHVAALAFRPDESVTGSHPAQVWDLSVDLSTGARTAGSLSGTFDDNHGSDRARLFDGNLLIASAQLGAPPHHGALLIPLDEPFVWNPRLGPLVVDIRCRGLVSGTGRPMDAALAASGELARVAHTSDPDAAIANTGPQPTALVCELVLDNGTVPAGLEAGNPGANTALPWNVPAGSSRRVQWIYDGSEVDLQSRQSLTRIAFRPLPGIAFAGRTYDLRMTLSTGAPGLATSGPSASFAANHGPDRTVVFDGTWTPGSEPAVTAPGRFGVQLEFDRSFDFNPDSGSLVVEVELRSVSGPTSSNFQSVAAQPGVARVRAGSVGATSGVVENEAMLVDLAGYPVPVLPEIADGSEGSLMTALPWGDPGALRYQVGFARNQLGAEHPVEVTHLSWRIDGSAGAFGPVTYHAKIDMGRVATLPMTLFMQANGALGRVNVFDGTFSVPHVPAGSSRADDFEITVRLDRPFRWDPSLSPLVIDVQKYPTVAGTGPSALDSEAGAAADICSTWFLGLANATFSNSGSPAEATVVRLGGSVGANALTTPYGVGCAGAAGVPIASSIGLPWLGNDDFRMAVFRGAPGASAAFLFGLSRTNNPLDAIGAIGCVGLTSGDFGTLDAVVDANGVASIPASVPDMPAFAGGVFTTQWAILDGSAPGGVVMSNGLEITLR